MKRLGIEFIICFFSVMLLIHSANALSVGAFRSTKEKTVFEGETARFTINFFNLGNQPVVVNLKVETPLHVEYPDGQKIILKPSSSVADSDSWFHLKGNQYVKTKRLSFDVQAPYVKQDSTYTIKALAEIRPKDSSTDSEIYQSVAEVIEYIFKLNVKNKVPEYNETQNNETLQNETQNNEIEVKSNNTKNFFEVKEEHQNLEDSIKTDVEDSTETSSLNLITGNFVIPVSIVVFTLFAVIIIIAGSRF